MSFIETMMLGNIQSNKSLIVTTLQKLRFNNVLIDQHIFNLLLETDLKVIINNLLSIGYKVKGKEEIVSYAEMVKDLGSQQLKDLALKRLEGIEDVK